MRALLWKDLRVMRVVLAYAFSVLLCVYAVGCLINVYSQWRYGFPARDWSSMLFICAMCSLGLELPAAAMLGGCSFAAERADRAAEFMAYLPVSRGKVVLSKAALTLSVLGLVWVVNLAVLFAVESRIELSDSSSSIGTTTQVLVAICACMFGVAWFCSAMVNSHALATCLGIIIPLLLGGIVFFVSDTFGLSQAIIDHWFPRCCGALGAIGFLLGWRHYLHRVEP